MEAAARQSVSADFAPLPEITSISLGTKVPGLNRD